MNKEKVITLGNKKTDHKKEIKQVVEIKPNENIRYISGGRAIKSSTFTYIAFHVDNYDEEDLQEEIEGHFKSQSDFAGVCNYMVLGANSSVGKSSMINVMIGDKITKNDTKQIEAFQNDRFGFYDTPSFKGSGVGLVEYVENLFTNMKNGISGLVFMEDSTNLEISALSYYLLSCFHKFAQFSWQKSALFVLTKCESEVKASEFITLIKEKLSIEISENSVVCIDIDDAENKFKTGDQAIKDLINSISVNNKNVFIKTQEASKLNICSVLFESMLLYESGEEKDTVLKDKEGQEEQYEEMMNCIKAINDGEDSNSFAEKYEGVMSS